MRYHITGWISWFGKADKLQFYNNEEDYIKRPLIPLKPCRRPKTETKEEYHRHIAEWEATKPYTCKIKVQGNTIT